MIFNNMIGNEKSSKELLRNPEKLRKMQKNAQEMIMKQLKKRSPDMDINEQRSQSLHDEYKWNRVSFNEYNVYFSQLRMMYYEFVYLLKVRDDLYYDSDIQRSRYFEKMRRKNDAYYLLIKQVDFTKIRRDSRY
jgi:hypothetical protein